MPADHMANDDHATPLLASGGAADRCAPPAPTAGILRTADLGRGNFAGMKWASADLMKKLAAVDAWALPPPASPARLFGSAAGAMALADAVGATEPRRIERLETEVAELKARLSPRTSPPQPTEGKTKGRQGRKRREGGLTCEEQMLLLAELNPTVMIMKPPAIREQMLARWGEENAFCIRTIQDTLLYKGWQKVLEEYRKETGMSESDISAAGLENYSHKPGREDKRKLGRAKAEQAYRAFKNGLTDTNIETNRRIDSKKEAQKSRHRQ